MRIKNITTKQQFEAERWFKNGDNTKDGCYLIKGSDGKEFWSEGKVVRYYRHPGVDGSDICPICQQTMHSHGFIDQPQNGLAVCPGSWVLKDDFGIYSVVRDLELMAEYVRI